MKNISIIGAGTMGNGIAHLFAQNGFAVNLVDINKEQLEKAMSSISKNLDRQIAKAFITEEIKKSALANITLQTDIETGLKNADLVVEAATENEALKLKIFKQADDTAPLHCILATNTSSISIT